MKKILTLLLSLAIASSAFAITWTDYDSGYRGGPLDFLNEKYGHNDSSYDMKYTGTFNILNDGYDPTKHMVDYAKVGFAFADDEASDRGGSYEYVDISIDSTKIWNDLEVSGSHSSGYEWHFQWLGASSLSSLQDGIVSYTVYLQEKLSDRTKPREDTYLKRASLKAWGSTKNVPDSGSSLMLLGVSLISLASLKRSLRKGK